MRRYEITCFGGTAAIPTPIATAMLLCGFGNLVGDESPRLVSLVEGLRKEVAARTAFRLPRRQIVVRAMAVLLLVICTAALVPTTAQADSNFLLDPGGWLFECFKDEFNDALVKFGSGMLTPALTSLTNGFLSDAGAVDRASQVWTIPVDANGFHASASSSQPLYVAYNLLFAGSDPIYNHILPISETICAVVFGIKTIKIVQEPDTSASGVPYFEKFAWLGIRFALLKWLLDYSLDLTILLFNTIITRIAQPIVNAAGAAGASAIVTEDVMSDWVNNIIVGAGLTAAGWLGGLLLIMVEMLLVILVSVILAVLARFCVWSRWLQTFTYLLFAPVFFAFAGLDETKSMFIAYLKTMMALGLAFVITMLVIIMIPPIFVSTILNSATSGGVFSIYDTIATLALGIMFCQALVSCGGWARDLIGG